MEQCNNDNSGFKGPHADCSLDPLSDPMWMDHKIGDTYTMDGKPEEWKIAYYPVLCDGKTKEVYKESRALVERPITSKDGQKGIDFREVPFRYLTKKIKS